jgi:hypothetical protein
MIHLGAYSDPVPHLLLERLHVNQDTTNRLLRGCRDWFVRISRVAHPAPSGVP